MSNPSSEQPQLRAGEVYWYEFRQATFTVDWIAGKKLLGTWKYPHVNKPYTYEYDISFIQEAVQNGTLALTEAPFL